MEPWTQFFYTPESSGAETIGSNLEIELNVDTTGMVFIAGDDDVSTASLEELLKIVYTKSLWLSDRVEDTGANSAGLATSLPIIEAEANVTISGDNDPPTAFDSLFSSSGQSDDNPDE